MNWKVGIFQVQPKPGDFLKQVQRRAVKIIPGLEHLFYEDGMRELELFILEKRKLWSL